MTRILFDKKENSNFRLMLLKDGRISMNVYENHICFHFEPVNGGYRTIVRLYSHAGKLIKQWKGIGFGRGCDLHVNYMKSNNDTTEQCEAGIIFFCENGAEFISCEDDQLSIYDLFPSLPKYS